MPAPFDDCSLLVRKRLHDSDGSGGGSGEKLFLIVRPFLCRKARGVTLAEPGTSAVLAEPGTRHAALVRRIALAELGAPADLF